MITSIIAPESAATPPVLSSPSAPTSISVQVRVISSLSIDPSISQEDGFIEFFCSGDTPTILPFKAGDFDSNGQSKPSFQQKFKSKVLYLGSIETNATGYFGVTQSKEKLRDTLGTISDVLKTVGGLIPPQFAPIAGATQILSALLQFLKTESPDVAQAAKFVSLKPGANMIGALAGGKPLLNVALQEKVVVAQKLPTATEYRILVSNLDFKTVGNKVSLPTPTTIQTTKGPRLTVGSGASTVDVAEWIENVIGTMTCECQSPLAGKPQTYHVPVQGTLQASWETFEVLRVKASQGLVPLSLAFSMSPKSLNLAAYGDVVSAVLGASSKFGVNVPTEVTKAVQPAFATLAGLFSDSLELLHFNGAIALDGTTGVDGSASGCLLSLNNGSVSLTQAVYNSGQQIGTFSCKISVEKIDSPIAPPSNGTNGATPLSLSSPRGTSIETLLPEIAQPVSLNSRLSSETVTLSDSVPRSTPSRPSNVPAVVDVYGPDYVNQSYSWSRLQGAGVIGVLHKCTENTIMADDAYPDAIKGAKAAKLLFGAYHFSRPGAPERQADHFLTTAQLQPGDIAAIDIEPRDPSLGPDDCMSLGDVVIWAKYVERALGRKPLIYGGGGGLRELLEACSDQAILAYLSQCPLWLADYSQPLQVPVPWSNYTLLQYQGDYHGLSGLAQCDLNRFQGPDDALRAWWTGKTPAATSIIA